MEIVSEWGPLEMNSISVLNGPVGGGGNSIGSFAAGGRRGLVKYDARWEPRFMGWDLETKRL